MIGGAPVIDAYTNNNHQVFISLLTRNLMYDSVLSIVSLTDGLMSRNHNPD